MEKGGGRTKRLKKSDPHPGFTAPTSKSGALFDDCDLISVETNIVNPTSVVETLEVGDVLAIELNKNVLEVYYKSKFCGNIVLIISDKIISCIKKGRTFIAIITLLKKRACKVLVQVSS
jgi:hypothetical protein